MNIGFTGTRYGMTYPQKRVALAILQDWKALIPERDEITVHHGSCIGADSEVHELAKLVGLRIVIHPPEDESKMAHLGIDDPDVTILPSKPYLARNRDIVETSSLMIGCVDSYEPHEHSGTWYTIDHANKKEIPVMIVFPDGTDEAVLGSSWLASFVTNARAKENNEL